MLIGVDIGGTKCAVIAAKRTETGVDILAREAFATAGKTPQAVIERFDGVIRRFTEKEPCEAIGISCGGPLDSEKGVILSPPNLPGWDHIEITRHFSEVFGVPTRLINDANASALAEWKYGAGIGTKNMVFLTFGTGLGAGLIVNGALFEGTNGMAGEAGHMRLAPFGPSGYGKCGSFEGFCSGGGIGRLAQAMARKTIENGGSTLMCEDAEGIGRITAKIAAEAAENGDETAIEVYKICGEKLGEGLAIIADILDPQAIIIGSIFARSGHLLRDSMEKALHREALKQTAECKIIPAGLGEKIGDSALLAIALDAAANGGET